MEKFKAHIEIEDYQGKMAGTITIFGKTDKIGFMQEMHPEGMKKSIEIACLNVNRIIQENYEERQVPKMVKKGSE